MPTKKVKMKISKNERDCYSDMSQGSINTKNRFLGKKVCPVLVNSVVNTEDILSCRLPGSKGGGGSIGGLWQPSMLVCLYPWTRGHIDAGRSDLS